MADDDTATSDTGAATDDTSTTPTTDTTPDPAATATADVDKWKALARKHEAESKKNAAAAKRLAEIEEAGKSELERAQKAAADAETRIKAAEDRANRALMRAAVMAAATKLGAVDPDAVLQLLPSDAIEIDGDTVRGVDAAVKALLESKPYLVAPKGPPKPAAGSADQGARGSATGVTREQLKTMSAAEIARLPASVIDKAMSEPY